MPNLREMIWTKKKMLKLCLASTLCLAGLTMYFFVSALYQVKYGYLKNMNVLADYWSSEGNSIRAAIVRKLQGNQDSKSIKHPMQSNLTKESESLKFKPMEDLVVKNISSYHQKKIDDKAGKNGSHGDLIVPNIVHFVWIPPSPRNLLFTEMVSILSADVKQKAGRIYLHCNEPPNGVWWDELINKFKLKIEIKYIDYPLKIGPSVLNSTQDVSHFVKMKALKDYGGIFLSMDVIVVNSFNNLRVFPFLLGKSRSHILSPSVMLSARNSSFTEVILTDMQDTVISGKKMNIDFVKCLTSTATRLPNLVHLESDTLTFPEHTNLLYTDNHHVVYWRNYPVIHLRFHQGENKIYSPQYIKNLKNLIGSVLRLIYSGSSDVEDKYLPHVMYKIGLTKKPN